MANTPIGSAPLPPPPPPPAGGIGGGGGSAGTPIDLTKTAGDIDKHKAQLADRDTSNDQAAMSQLNAIDKNLKDAQAAEEAKGSSGDPKRLDSIEAMRADIADTKKKFEGKT